ncbi:hypothetical protein FGO68_gene11058 [Halteria grandinella]|uniref:Uncharacterized protein n=1 Tax=Halteria grandinella TaxID=5974 RepID=A0A8J8T501_HALGN|nr:hypothetical protein FGO68_gene11058 [Halteria grandinella]
MEDLRQLRLHIGKIRSKYIIIRIITESLDREEASNFLFYTDTKLRRVVIEIPHVIINSLAIDAKFYNLYSIQKPRGQIKLSQDARDQQQHEQTQFHSGGATLMTIPLMIGPLCKFNVYIKSLFELRILSEIMMVKGQISINKMIIASQGLLEDQQFADLLDQVGPFVIETCFSSQQMSLFSLRNLSKQTKIVRISFPYNWHRFFVPDDDIQTEQPPQEVDVLHVSLYAPFLLPDILTYIRPVNMLILELPPLSEKLKQLPSSLKNIKELVLIIQDYKEGARVLKGTKAKTYMISNMQDQGKDVLEEYSENLIRLYKSQTFSHYLKHCSAVISWEKDSHQLDQMTILPATHKSLSLIAIQENASESYKYRSFIDSLPRDSQSLTRNLTLSIKPQVDTQLYPLIEKTLSLHRNLQSLEISIGTTFLFSHLKDSKEGYSFKDLRLRKIKVTIDQSEFQKEKDQIEALFEKLAIRLCKASKSTLGSLSLPQFYKQSTLEKASPCLMNVLQSLCDGNAKNFSLQKLTLSSELISPQAFHFIKKQFQNVKAITIKDANQFNTEISFTKILKLPRLRKLKIIYSIAKGRQQTLPAIYSKQFKTNAALNAQQIKQIVQHKPKGFTLICNWNNFNQVVGSQGIMQGVTQQCKDRVNLDIQGLFFYETTIRLVLERLKE